MHERRKYRRIHAPLYCRPAGVPFLARQRQPIDLSLGGVRIYSDDPLKLGELLKMEFFLPETTPVTYTAEVVWIEPMPDGAPARFDVGLKFLHLEPAALSLLVSVLGPLEDQLEDPRDRPGATSDVDAPDGSEAPDRHS
jgi:PilZ domain